MANSAFQTQYREEFIAGFERRQSLLRQACTTDTEQKGNQVYFLVADSAGATAVTRGLNGKIPERPDNLSQIPIVLSEWHDLRTKTGFNIFASQGDSRRIMQMNSMAVMNRKMDDQIITELAKGTNTTGTAAGASLDLVGKATEMLMSNDVPFDNQVTAIITPAFYRKMRQIDQFTNFDYVAGKPLEGMAMNFRWYGVNWIVMSSGLPGQGSASEKCFMFHKEAIGHACRSEGISTAVGYDDKQDYTWARTSCYMGAKILQDKGIIVINHNATA